MTLIANYTVHSTATASTSKAMAAYLAEQGNHRCVALDLASCYESIDHKVVLLAIIKQIAPQLELFSDELNEAYARVDYGVYKKIHK